jgi:hypothetical protein
MKKIALCFLAGLMIAASLHAQALSEEETKMILDEVNAAFKDGQKAGENLDADLLSERIDDSLNAGHIINGVFFSSFDPIMERVTSNMQGLNSLQYVINDKKITVLSKDAAILAVSGRTKAESTSGQEFSTPFAWTFIYRKTGDQWKVIHSHQSNPR